MDRRERIEGKKEQQSLEVKIVPNKQREEIKFCFCIIGFCFLHKFWCCDMWHVLYCMFSWKSQTETSHHGFGRARPPLSHVSTMQSPLGLGSISYIINHSLIDIWQAVSTPGYATTYSMEKF